MLSSIDDVQSLALLTVRFFETSVPRSNEYAVLVRVGPTPFAVDLLDVSRRSPLGWRWNFSARSMFFFYRFFVGLFAAVTGRGR
jgi:hypothetical protein